jgi:hypothetical protein
MIWLQESRELASFIATLANEKPGG